MATSPDPAPSVAPLGLRAMARRLDVPAYWLRREAAAGRIPAVAAGATYLFDGELVGRILLERARAAAAETTPDRRPQREEVRDVAQPR